MSLLLSTKFAPPRLGRKAIQRARLLERLRDSRHCRLIVVTGSAGFGKTTLLAQWRQELLLSGSEVSWLLLGPADAHLRQFWGYFTDALTRLGIAAEEETLLFGDMPEKTVDDAIVDLVLNKAAALAKELFLIIDDYHFVEDPAIHDLLYRLVSQAPDNLHIVLASRTQPPIPVGRLLGLGQISEIQSQEMPFDAQEVADFVTHNVAATLHPEDTRLIYEHSLGWPAAVQLVAIRLNRSPRSRTTPAALVDLSERAGDLSRYLEEDVVQYLAADLVLFLETISLCPRFDAELAGVLSGRANAAALLQQIESDNLFLARIELDEGREWFRMHRLFADFLKDRRTRHGKDWEMEIHRRASRWFAAHDFVPEALRHAQLAGDLDFAVAVVTEAATFIRRLADAGTLLRWIDELPAETIQTNPKLLHLGSWALVLNGHADKAELWVDRLAALPAATIPDLAQQLAVVRTGIAMARDDTSRAEAELAVFAGKIPDNSFLASSFVMCLTLCAAAMGEIDAAQILGQKWRAARADDPPSDHAIAAHASLFTAHLAVGDVYHVEKNGPILLAQADALYGRRSSCAGICATLLASAYVERDRLSEARELLSSVAKILRLATPEVMIQGTLAQARLHCLGGEPLAALASLTHAEHRFQERRLDRAVALMLAASAAIHLDLGDIRQAALIQNRLDDLAQRYAEAPGWRGEIPAIKALAAARLAMAERRDEETLRHLAQLTDLAHRRNRRRLLVIADLMAAAVSTNRKQPADAVRHLAAALAAAKSLGLVRTVIDELSRLPRATRDALTALLVDMAATGDGAARDYAWRLPAQPEAPSSSKPSAKPAAPAVPPAGLGITEREAAILRLLSQSMSNKRIAITLNLSVGTVNWNLNNIYAKIGVSSRYDALTWARNNGIVVG